MRLTIRSTVAGSKPLIISGVAIGRSIAPSWAPAADGNADRLDVGRALSERCQPRIGRAQRGRERLGV